MGFYNYTYHLLVFIREVFTLLLIFSIFAFTNFQASLIASIFLLFLTILYVKYVKPIIKTRSINNQIFRKNMSQSIMEAFKAIQDIKIYNKELYVKKNFLENVNKFEYKEVEKDLKRKVVFKEAEIINSLYSGAINVGIQPNVIIDFARIYGFQIDFQRDIWKNDRFQIIYETFSPNVNETPLKNERLGLGLSVVSDEIGPAQEDYVDLNLSYTIPFTESTELSFGLKAGFHNLSTDWSKGMMFDSADAAFSQNISLFSPTIGAGLYMHSNKWYLGMSIPNFLVNDPVAIFLTINSIGIISTSLTSCSLIFNLLTK